jgi:hypothetical protein
MSLIRAPGKENNGAVIFRGGLIDAVKLANLQRSIPKVPEMQLRGFSSCSFDEREAAKFMSWAVPTEKLVRVMYRIQTPNKTMYEAELGKLWVGAGLSIKSYAPAHLKKEEEVLLLDATTLPITNIERNDCESWGFEKGEKWRYEMSCVKIDAYVDWEKTTEYFRILCGRSAIREDRTVL